MWKSQRVTSAKLDDEWGDTGNWEIKLERDINRTTKSMLRLCGCACRYVQYQIWPIEIRETPICVFLITWRTFFPMAAASHIKVITIQNDFGFVHTDFFFSLVLYSETVQISRLKLCECQNWKLSALDVNRYGWLRYGPFKYSQLVNKNGRNLVCEWNSNAHRLGNAWAEPSRT